MSKQDPRLGTPSRRRRIAGERKPDHPAAFPTRADSSEEPPVPVAPPKPSPVEATEPVPAREPRAVGLPVLAALAVIAVGLVAFAASGFLVDGIGVQAWRSVESQEQIDSAERAAPIAAERAAAAILSYSYKSLEADRDNAARFMTGDYRSQYLDTFGLVLDNAPGVKAVVDAEVRASGVAHADADRVNVLLYVNQTTTSTANEGEPQRALNRVMFTMAERAGTWLVDDITSF